jgi:hypothetical protein
MIGRNYTFFFQCLFSRKLPQSAVRHPDPRLGRLPRQVPHRQCQRHRSQPISQKSNVPGMDLPPPPESNPCRNQHQHSPHSIHSSIILFTVLRTVLRYDFHFRLIENSLAGFKGPPHVACDFFLSQVCKAQPSMQARKAAQAAVGPTAGGGRWPHRRWWLTRQVPNPYRKQRAVPSPTRTAP